MIVSALIWVLIIMGILAIMKPAHAETAYPANLWQGLIAEATSDGYDGMYAVACVVRNRLNIGMNTGLCGLKRKDLEKFCQREGQKQCQIAKKIIYKVFIDNSFDVTKGATNFECIERYGKPSWAKNMVITCKIGEHTFMKVRTK